MSLLHYDPTNSDTTEEDDGKIIDGLFERVTNDDIHLNAIVVSTAHAVKSIVIKSSHLDKVWRIDIKAEELTLGVTYQNSKFFEDPTLS